MPWTLSELVCHFTSAYMNGWMYGRTDDLILSEPTFLGCIDDQIFVPMVLHCTREVSASICNIRNIPN